MVAGFDCLICCLIVLFAGSDCDFWLWVLRLWVCGLARVLCCGFDFVAGWFGSGVCGYSCVDVLGWLVRGCLCCYWWLVVSYFSAGCGLYIWFLLLGRFGSSSLFGYVLCWVLVVAC